MRALAETARLRAEQVRDAGLPTLDRLDDQTRTLIDRILVANGAADALAAGATALHARAPREGAVSTRLLAGEADLAFLCAFQDEMKAMQDAIRPFQLAAPLVALAGLAGGPATAAFLIAFADMAIDFGISADLAGLLAKLFPQVDDRLVVTTSKSVIPPNSSEPAILRVRGKVFLGLDPCREGLSTLIQLLATEALKGLLSKVPRPDLVRMLFDRNGYGPDVRLGTVAEQVAQLEGFLDEVVDKLSSGAIGASELDGVLDRARLKLCGIYRDREEPIQPTPQIFAGAPIPAAAGALQPFNQDNVHFSCAPGFNGTATFPAAYACGARKLAGSVQVTCGEETCTEDALQDLVRNLGDRPVPPGRVLPVREPRGAPGVPAVHAHRRAALPEQEPVADHRGQLRHRPRWQRPALRDPAVPGGAMRQHPRPVLRLPRAVARSAEPAARRHLAAAGLRLRAGAADATAAGDEPVPVPADPGGDQGHRAGHLLHVRLAGEAGVLRRRQDHAPDPEGAPGVPVHRGARVSVTARTPPPPAARARPARIPFTRRAPPACPYRIPHPRPSGPVGSVMPSLTRRRSRHQGRAARRT